MPGGDFAREDFDLAQQHAILRPGIGGGGNGRIEGQPAAGRDLQALLLRVIRPHEVARLMVKLDVQQLDVGEKFAQRMPRSACRRGGRTQRRNPRRQQQVGHPVIDIGAVIDNRHVDLFSRQAGDIAAGNIDLEFRVCLPEFAQHRQQPQLQQGWRNVDAQGAQADPIVADRVQRLSDPLEAF